MTETREGLTARGVTELLLAWNGGDRAARDQLMEVIYGELRLQARFYLEHQPGNTALQPTALVHELYLRLVDQDRVGWQSRAHFFGSAGRLMRQILVDHARARQARKRGGGMPTLSLDEVTQPDGTRHVDLIVLDEALDELAEMDRRQSKIVELRYFAGLSIKETAEVLGVGTATVSREWRAAKAWLFHRIRFGIEPSVASR